MKESERASTGKVQRQVHVRCPFSCCHEKEGNGKKITLNQMYQFSMVCSEDENTQTNQIKETSLTLELLLINKKLITWQHKLSDTPRSCPGMIRFLDL